MRDRTLSDRDLALLEALDEHTNVRYAMLAAASLDPRTAATAQKAYAAAERRSEFSSERGSIRYVPPSLGPSPCSKSAR